MSRFIHGRYCQKLPSAIQESRTFPDFEVRHDRLITKSFSDDDVTIAHGDNPAYWIRRHLTSDSEFGVVARLQTVCWLELSFDIRGVPPGRYLAYVRMKSEGRNFSGNWRVGMGSRSIRQFEHDEAVNDHETVTFIPKSDNSLPVGQWVYVIIGMLQISFGVYVRFHFLGGSPFWTCSIQFDHGGLLPIQVGWNTKRLLLLGMLGSRNLRTQTDSGNVWDLKSLLSLGFVSKKSSSCHLRLLNQDCILHVLRFL